MRFHLDVKECSFGADSRIHDNDVKSLAGEIGNRSGEKERRVRKILRRDLMAQIDDPSIGIDAQDYAFHGRDVGGFLAKISRESDNRVRHSNHGGDDPPRPSLSESALGPAAGKHASRALAARPNGSAGNRLQTWQ